MLWVLKQWMPQVMSMQNSGHLLKTESPENLGWQLAEHIMEKILSSISQSISASHIRKSSYPDRSKGRGEVVRGYISISRKGKGAMLGSLGNDKTMERKNLKLWKVCSSALPELSLLQSWARLNLPKVLSEKEKGVHTLLTVREEEAWEAGSPKGCAVCELESVGLESGKKALHKTHGAPQTWPCLQGVLAAGISEDYGHSSHFGKDTKGRRARGSSTHQAHR